MNSRAESQGSPAPQTEKGPDEDFYLGTLKEFLGKGWMRAEMRVVVLCGGMLDKQMLAKAGFKHVTITNLDPRIEKGGFAPFEWSLQDAEHTSFKDEEFDFGIVHAGLHHCASPHRALLELYRVVKTGLLVFEPRDNWLARLGIRLNFGQEYEVAAVFDTGCRYGGFKNTEIPNYVYRWTEREFKKTIASFAPWGRHQFVFRYDLRIPWERLTRLRRKSLGTVMTLLIPFLKLFTFLFPKQCNKFALAVFKPKIPKDLHPWISLRDHRPVPNKAWICERYG